MAGEIQLNSTTLATESSGSITAQLDTIRPNTTNGSLVLQGDSSDAGVTGLTIDSSGNATFAQTISGGTLGSSVVFPAGHILQVVYADRTGSANKSITSTSSYQDADLNTGSITQKQSGSKIIVIAKVTQAPTGLTSAYYRSAYFGFNTTNSGVYSSSFGQIIGKSSGSVTDEDNYLYPFTVGTWMINTPSSTFTIYLTAMAAIGSSTYIGGGNYHTSLTVYEIA